MTRADGVLIALAVILVAGLYTVLWQGGPGERAEILTVAGQPMAVALDRARTITVPGRLGPSVIEVERGRARFIASPCSAKICIQAGWQERPGDIAACLPNGVSLVVGGDARRFDAINY